MVVDIELAYPGARVDERGFGLYRSGVVLMEGPAGSSRFRTRKWAITSRRWRTWAASRFVRGARCGGMRRRSELQRVKRRTRSWASRIAHRGRCPTRVGREAAIGLDPIVSRGLAVRGDLDRLQLAHGVFLARRQRHQRVKPKNTVIVDLFTTRGRAEAALTSNSFTSGATGSGRRWSVKGAAARLRKPKLRMGLAKQHESPFG